MDAAVVAGVVTGVAWTFEGSAVGLGGEFNGAPTAISQRWPGFPCSGFRPAATLAGWVLTVFTFVDGKLTAGCVLETGRLAGGIVMVDVVFAVSCTTGGNELFVVSGEGVTILESMVVFVSVESVEVDSEPQEANTMDAILAAKKNLFIFFIEAAR